MTTDGPVRQKSGPEAAGIRDTHALRPTTGRTTTVPVIPLWERVRTGVGR